MSRDTLYEQRFTLRNCSSPDRYIGVTVFKPSYQPEQRRVGVTIQREKLFMTSAAASADCVDAFRGEARSLTAQALSQTIEEVDAVIAELQTHLVWLHRALREFRAEQGDAFMLQLQAVAFALAVQKSRRDYVNALQATEAKRAKAAR